MAKIESYKPGSFVWAELHTTDVAAAKNFYGDMFGWTYIDHPMPNGVYTIFQADGNDVAAAVPAMPGMPPNWGVYFSVTDLDASTAKVTELGGEVAMGPMDVGDPGSMTLAKDPDGVHFALWKGKNHIGSTHGGPLNRVVWPELMTPDEIGAVDFYTGLFGWSTKPASGIESAEYVEWVNHGESIGGMLPMRGDQWQGVPPHWQVYVTVADCDERVARATALGAKICVPPRDIPNTGRFAMFFDPQGAAISIIQMTGTHQPAAA